MASERITMAAGGVVWRTSSAGGGRKSLEVLTIHRPAYDDWTFPKGKQDPGETLQATAVREIAEETGVRVRLGLPIAELSYPISGGTKSVAYWCARVVGDSDEPFVPNKEVDEIRWTSLRGAHDLMTYQHDRTVLETFAALADKRAHRARTLIVLRHAKAEPRAESHGDDLARPLTEIGTDRAKALVDVLGAYGVRRVVSSPALRCAQTVEPYAHSISTFLEIDDRLAEDTRASQVQRSVSALMDRKKAVVLCSHLPTMPWVFDAVGIDTEDLSPGHAIVVHHRKGAVLATEKIV